MSRAGATSPGRTGPCRVSVRSATRVDQVLFATSRGQGRAALRRQGCSPRTGPCGPTTPNKVAWAGRTAPFDHRPSATGRAVCKERVYNEMRSLVGVCPRDRKMHSERTTHRAGYGMQQDQYRDRRGAVYPVSLDAHAPTVPDDLVAMLDLLAETIVQALGFGVAAVHIARPDGSLEVIAVAGDEQARKTLLGTVDSADIWDQVLAESEPWGRLRFADHRNEAANPELLSWVPDFVPIATEDAWHPQDALFAPLIAEDGSRLGVLSVDLPYGGRRPGSATCNALGAFAVSTALAIEHATLRSRAESSERSLQQLAKQDSLTGVGNRSMLFERLQDAATARAERSAVGPGVP